LAPPRALISHHDCGTLSSLDDRSVLQAARLAATRPAACYLRTRLERPRVFQVSQGRPSVTRRLKRPRSRGYRSFIISATNSNGGFNQGIDRGVTDLLPASDTNCPEHRQQSALVGRRRRSADGSCFAALRSPATSALRRDKGCRPFPRTPISAGGILPPLRFGQLALDEAEHFQHKSRC